jgi:hypothetical protein
VWSKHQLKTPQISFSHFGINGDYGNIKLKFIHIPKTAGTSIENYGFLHAIKWGKVDISYYNSFNINTNYGKWHSTFKTLPHDFYEGFDLFCVVRNPYDRIFSAVFCGFKDSYPKTIEELNKEIIDRIHDENIHFVKQSDFVYKDGIQKVKYILKFENLKYDMEKLLKMYGINSEFNINHNKSQTKYFSIKELYPETIQLINTFYKSDFENFGYQMI